MNSFRIEIVNHVNCPFKERTFPLFFSKFIFYLNLSESRNLMDQSNRSEILRKYITKEFVDSFSELSKKEKSEKLDEMCELIKRDNSGVAMDRQFLSKRIYDFKKRYNMPKISVLYVEQKNVTNELGTKVVYERNRDAEEISEKFRGMIVHNGNNVLSEEEKNEFVNLSKMKGKSKGTKLRELLVKNKFDLKTSEIVSTVNVSKQTLSMHRRKVFKEMNESFFIKEGSKVILELGNSGGTCCTRNCLKAVFENKNFLNAHVSPYFSLTSVKEKRIFIHSFIRKFRTFFLHDRRFRGCNPCLTFLSKIFEVSNPTASNIMRFGDELATESEISVKFTHGNAGRISSRRTEETVETCVTSYINSLQCSSQEKVRYGPAGVTSFDKLFHKFCIYYPQCEGKLKASTFAKLVN